MKLVNQVFLGSKYDVSILESVFFQKITFSN